jgi:hypothetical protein
MRNSFRYASYGGVLLLGVCLGIYKGDELGRQRAGFIQFAEGLSRSVFEEILFQEGTDDAKVDLIRAQLAYADRQFVKGDTWILDRKIWLRDYEIYYARLAAFSELKGDSASNASYMKEAISYCLKVTKKQDDCDAEKLRYLADLLDHRKAFPTKDAKGLPEAN